MYDTGRSYPESCIRLSLYLVDDVFDDAKCESYKTGMKYKVTSIVCRDEIYQCGFAYFFDAGTHDDITNNNTQSGSYVSCYTESYNYRSYKASWSENFFDIFSSTISEAIDESEEDENTHDGDISCRILES